MIGLKVGIIFLKDTNALSSIFLFNLLFRFWFFSILGFWHFLHVMDFTQNLLLHGASIRLAWFPWELRTGEEKSFYSRWVFYNTLFLLLFFPNQHKHLIIAANRY